LLIIVRYKVRLVLFVNEEKSVMMWWDRGCLPGMRNEKEYELDEEGMIAGALQRGAIRLDPKLETA
jgi:hypothetical protein